MPWNAGVYTRTNGEFVGPTVWQQDEAGGYDIEAPRHDVHDEDMAQGISDCLNVNGENAMAADLSMGGHRLTGAGVGSADGDSMTKGQADSTYFARDGSVAAVAELDMGGFAIKNVGTPVAANDGVSLSYAQSVAGLAGNVASNGSIDFGAGFTVNKTGTGTYQLNFTAAAPSANAQAFLATAQDGPVSYAMNTTTRITVRVRTSGGALADGAFSFERRWG